MAVNEKQLYKNISVSNGVTSPPVTSKQYRGVSTVANPKGFNLYDLQIIKQDIINHFHIRQGEKLENPEFGTIIYDAIFEPFTEALKDAIIEDLTANLNADPRLSTGDITVREADKGIAIEASITFVPLNITEKLSFNFDENSLLRLS